jgi:hypothetical protein
MRLTQRSFTYVTNSTIFTTICANINTTTLINANTLWTAIIRALLASSSAVIAKMIIIVSFALKPAFATDRSAALIARSAAIFIIAILFLAFAARLRNYAEAAIFIDAFGFPAKRTFISKILIARLVFFSYVRDYTWTCVLTTFLTVPDWH